jgi:hypothetical protein
MTYSSFVGIAGHRRFLFTPLDQVQLADLSSLNVTPSIFTKINAPPTGTGRAGQILHLHPGQD